MAEQANQVEVGTAHIECPECGEVMPAAVTCQIIESDEGGQTLACTPDMTDIWAHVWSHDNG